MNKLLDFLAATATCLIFGGCLLFFVFTLGRAIGSCPVAQPAISHRAGKQGGSGFSVAAC